MEKLIGMPGSLPALLMTALQMPVLSMTQINMPLGSAYHKGHPMTGASEVDGRTGSHQAGGSAGPPDLLLAEGYHVRRQLRTRSQDFLRND